MSRHGPRALVAWLMLLAVSCENAVDRPGSLASPADQSRPYVVTAIDYHFHDAHPSVPLAPGRTLIVRSQGRNVHNVTFVDLDYSQNVRPGGQLVFRDVATFLGGPGTYRFFCKLHVDRGMKGTIVIAG